jgi:RNA polymerase sigma-70 factor (ECF subfamily)
MPVTVNKHNETGDLLYSSPSSATGTMMEPTPDLTPATNQASLRAVLDQRSLLLGYINAIVRDLHVAEDVLQESLVLATKQTFQNEQHAHGWMRVTARNLSLAELRRRARRPITLTDEAFALLEPAWQELSEDGLHQGARLEALRLCLASLSNSARTLLDLRFREGLDGANLAARIGRPLNTVYVGLSRAYRRLAECIGRRLKEAS